MNGIYRVYNFFHLHKQAWKHKNERKLRDMEFISIGKGVRYSPFESYLTYKTIRLGDNVFINRGVHMSGKITIGDNVLIGPYAYITNGDHAYNEVGKYINLQKRMDMDQVVIGNDCWICARSVITKAVEIGEGCVIGASSVVTKNMPPYTICVGNPCRPVKKRYSDEELRVHCRILGRSEKEAETLVNKRNQMLSFFDWVGRVQ